MSRERALAMLAEAELLWPQERVAEAVERLARDITARLEDEFPLVLAIMGGAAVFSGQLLPRLAFPLEFGAIEATRYGKGTAGRELDWRLAPKDDVRGRTVLVVDDILDQGITLAAVRERLLSMGAKQVLCAVFADKDLPAEKPIRADFVGLRVPDRYVFGFGMDAYGLWRNLPAIHALKD